MVSGNVYFNKIRKTVRGSSEKLKINILNDPIATFLGNQIHL